MYVINQVVCRGLSDLNLNENKVRKILMEISVRNVGNIAVIDLGGNLILRENADELFERIQQMTNVGSSQILINLTQLIRMDSYGIGILIKSFKHAKGLNGHLKVSNPTAFVRQLLTISGLMTLMEVFDNESTALASF